MPTDRNIIVVGDYEAKTIKLLASIKTGKTPKEIQVSPIRYSHFYETVMVHDEPFTLGFFYAPDPGYLDMTRRMLYNETDMFVLCYSVVNPESFENIEKMWYPEIKSYDPNIPLFLVGNQLEARNDPLKIEHLRKKNLTPISFNEGWKLAKKLGALGYFECSYKLPETCKELLNIVALAVSGFPFSSYMEEIEHQMILAHGLRKGYVYITSIKLVIMGPPCVGKTAFKCLLFNWPAPKSHQSTAIAARPIRAIERVAERNEGKVWEMITGSELLKMLSDAMHALDDPADVGNYPSKKAEQNSSNNYSLKDIDHQEVAPLVDTVEIISQNAELPSLSNVVHEACSPSETENYNLTSEMFLKNVDNSSTPLTSAVDISNLIRQPLLSLPPSDLELMLNKLEDAVLGPHTHPEQNSGSATSLDNDGHSTIALPLKSTSSETNKPLQKSQSFSTGSVLVPATPKQMSTSMTHLENIDQQAVIAPFKVDFLDPKRQQEMSLQSTAKDLACYKRIKILSEGDTYTKEILDILASRKKSQQLHKATWIHLLDSGGQPQFADISRAFLRGNVVNIIVTKLTENLSDKPCFFYSLNGKILNQPTELQMTNLQLIEHFVRSLAASKNTIVAEGKKAITSKPRFVIVGTYLDQTKSMFKKQVVKESLDEKNAQLLSTLADFRDYLIFYNDTSNELIFPVDNLCRFNRKKISSTIRQRIMSQENVGITVPIPVRWYMFEINTKDEASKEDHGIISLTSCYDIGMKLGMERSEVENCVSYLDSLTLFLSFRKVLPNVIFTNPQYLLDTLSAFVRFSFVDSVSDILPNSSSALRHVQRVLREDGVFEEFLLDELSLTFVPSVFTKEDLLKLLEYLNIIAPLTTSDSVKRYFIPIVLPPCQMTEEDKTSFKRSCDPVIIEFTNKVVPQGMFPAVVVAMLDRKHKPHFFLDSRSRSFPRQLRYGIKLYSDDLLGSILLVDCFYWIEVYFTGLPENCPILRQVMKEAISSCAELLDYDIKSVEIEVTLPCLEKHKVDDGKLHGVIIKYNQGHYIGQCPVESEITFEVTDKRALCWFKVSSTLALPVNLPDGHLDESHLPGLLYAVREVYQWDILGTFLGILDSILQTINVNNHYQVEPSRKDMLIQWVNGGNASKAALIEALKNMKLQRIVSELESKQ